MIIFFLMQLELSDINYLLEYKYLNSLRALGEIIFSGVQLPHC